MYEGSSMLEPIRKTKIICTLGPATSNPEVFKQLYSAGMNIVRLNMSHGTRESHEEGIRLVKSFNKTANYPIAILLDTQGPEIRTGDIKENYLLSVGEKVDVTVDSDQSVEKKNTIVINYKNLIQQVWPGDRITVDNGLINLDVIEKTEFTLHCKVVDGGLIKSRRHINLPGIRVNLPAITSKDKQDITFALKHDIDFIALSFVRTPNDVKECQEIIHKNNGHAQVIAKIEDRFGVENYKEIIEVAYGVMVARGDLGVEVPIEELPIIQRRIIKEAAEQGKRTIVATHLLETMINHPIPSRAEVTDVANATYEESDCVMLSGETSMGKYPVKCVEKLHTICLRTERSGGIQWAYHRKTSKLKEKLCKAAVELANSQKAPAILVITRRGLTANTAASFHPKYSAIFAFTNMSAVRRKLIMSRGCCPFRIDFSENPEKTIQTAIQLILKRKLLAKGSTVIVISDIIATKERIDTIQVRSLH